VRAREGNDVDEQVDAVPDRGLELPRDVAIDAERARPSRDIDVPAGRGEGARRGPPDLAGPAEQQRAWHRGSLTQPHGCA
jgi:hypothetical protein